MTGARYRMRRAALALLACTLLVVTTAFAQDPRAATVQRVAREWLLLADQLAAAASWKAAGPRFQQAITVPRWAVGLKREREPRGLVVQRAITATSFASSFPGLPEGGNYALVQFRTSFEKSPGGAESVTLELGADGAWQVIGYVIS
jgi:hypothetical protein